MKRSPRVGSLLGGPPATPKSPRAATSGSRDLGRARVAGGDRRRAARGNPRRSGGRERRPVRVLRRRPGAVQRGGPTRCPRLEGDGLEGSAHQPLRARLEVGRAQPGHVQVGSVGPLHRRPGLARHPGRALRMGIASLGGQEPGAASARQRGPQARLGELPQGGRRPVWAWGLVLEQRLPPATRSERHPAADPLVAGVERAQSEEVLQPRGLRLPDRPPVRAPAEDLPRRDQEPGSDRPDRPRGKPGLSARRGPQGLGVPRPPVRTGRDQERIRRRCAPPVRIHRLRLHAGGPTRPPGHEATRRRGDPPMAHRVRLGIGTAGPVRHQPGAGRPGEVAAWVIRVGPAKSCRLERAAPLLVPLARSRPQFRLRPSL